MHQAKRGGVYSSLEGEERKRRELQVSNNRENPRPLDAIGDVGEVGSRKLEVKRWRSVKRMRKRGSRKRD